MLRDNYLQRNGQDSWRRLVLALVGGAMICGCSSADLVLAAEAALPQAAPLRVPRQPSGIDELHPRLSWVVESGQRASAKPLTRSSSPATRRGSGRTRATCGTAASRERRYDWCCLWRQAIDSRQQCSGRLRSGTRPESPPSGASGRCGAWRCSSRAIGKRSISASTTDTVAPLCGPAFPPACRQYRKEFSATKPVWRATIYATALGIYELHLNASGSAMLTSPPAGPITINGLTTRPTTLLHW